MADFSAKDIQKLRQDAGVGMMDAKSALTDADGDLEKAFELLRERGQAKMAKRADREANDGTIGSYIHIQNDRPVMGVLVELACETDFVAKSEEFRQTANDIAMHVSWGQPDLGHSRRGRPGCAGQGTRAHLTSGIGRGQAGERRGADRRREDRVLVRR